MATETTTTKTGETVEFARTTFGALPELAPCRLVFFAPSGSKVHTLESARLDRFGTVHYRTNGDAFEWSTDEGTTAKVVIES